MMKSMNNTNINNDNNYSNNKVGNNNSNIKQIFHAFLFNIRNYCPEVRNIQRSQ